MNQCNCPDPELCKRLGKHINGRLWAIWNNKVLTPEKCAQYRELWEREAVEQPLKVGEVSANTTKDNTPRISGKVQLANPNKIKSSPCGCGGK